jgi:hypothetical protein
MDKRHKGEMYTIDGKLRIILEASIGKSSGR